MLKMCVCIVIGFLLGYFADDIFPDFEDDLED